MNVMRKPAFCICEHKGKDQLRIDSTIPLLPKSEISIVLPSAQFGNPEDRFSCDKAQMNKSNSDQEHKVTSFSDMHKTGF